MTQEFSTKHTPGPWTAEPGGGRGAWVKGSTGEWAALACGDTDESAYANARLIAAAPDMLKLLGRAAEADSPDDDARTAWWEARNAAIAKATGAA